MSTRGLLTWFAVVVALATTFSLADGAHAQAKSSTKLTKATGPYRVTLIIGTAETMSMATGNSSERMLSGKNPTCQMMQMMNMPGMAKSKTQNCNHHVEVHVYDKKTGKVVTNASVSIKLSGKKLNGGSVTITVPIMKMQGMKAGPSDIHFGNNIDAPPGKYTVYITVNGVKTTFNVSLVGAM